MKILKKVFTNPIAIAIVIAHWLVFIFAMLYERHLIFREAISMHGPEPIIYNFMLSLNIPAGSVMEFAVAPVLSFWGIGKTPFMTTIVYSIFVALGSLQWFGLGYLISAVVEIYKPKEVKLSLK